MSFAQRLLELFDGASIATIARELAVPHSTIRNYINNDRLPSAEVLLLLANRTNVSLHWLLTGRGEKYQSDATSFDIQDVVDDPGQVAAIEELRRKWIEGHGRISYKDFVRTLLVHGEIAINSRFRTQAIAEQFEGQSFQGHGEFILARAVIEIVKQSLDDGDLREAIVEIFDEEADRREEMSAGGQPVELGSIDAFDLERAVETYRSPNVILNKWLAHEGGDLHAGDGVLFSGYERKTAAEKIAAICEARKAIEKAK